MSNVVRWGLIGFGDIVRRRVAAALRDAASSELLAVARGRADLAEEAAKLAGAPRPYASWLDLIADRDVDAVYVATPVHLHAEQTIAAAEAGKHVLCEKPMAMNVAQCGRMIAACSVNSVRLGIAYYRHFYPAVARIRRAVASGELGTIVLARMDVFEPFNPSPQEPRYWLMKKALAGGGPMFDFGCHRIEVLLNLFGPVRAVKGLAANVAFDREVEDTAVALFQFQSGACATLAVTHAAAAKRDTVEIFGTRGSLRIDDLNQPEVVVAIDGNRQTESHPPAANIHQPLVEDFVAAVLGGRDPAVTGEIGRAVARVEEQIYA